MNANNNDDIPLSLPLLDYVNKIFSLGSTRPFVGYKILAVQHLLGSTIPFFAMLEKGGAKPEDIYIVGKAYSSHPLVVNQLKRKGYQLDFNIVFDNNENKPYDTILEEHIISTTKTLLEKKGEDQKGLIIDDGGKAIKFLHHSYLPSAPRFSCVEQTSRGARTVSSLSLACPVVNVARSNAKTIYESPSIAKGMVDEFIYLLKVWEETGVLKLTNRNVLLLGYGFIGENVARQLQKYGFHITVFDTDINQLQKAASQGLATIAEKSKEFNAISALIGCTGTQVLKDEEYSKLKPGTLLVNMASTDTEFSAWNLRLKGKIIHQNILPSDKKYLSTFMPLSWRSLYKIDFPKTYIYLANGGFPSDFSGKINPIPAKDIQLTSALLLGGAVQAVQSKKVGFMDVDTSFQGRVLTEYLKL